MTAKFDAFKADLEALCIEHGVRLSPSGYEDPDIAVYDADESEPPVTGLWDGTRGTLEEQEARRLLREAEERAREEEHRQHHMRAMEHREAFSVRMADVGWYRATMEMVTADAKKQREECMRVSTDPTDPAYVDDRPRRAWCNDVEITDWTVADEFRRSVIDKAGKVHNGSVRVERLPDVVEVVVEAPVRTGDPEVVAVKLAADYKPHIKAKKRR